MLKYFYSLKRRFNLKKNSNWIVISSIMILVLIIPNISLHIYPQPTIIGKTLFFIYTCLFISLPSLLSIRAKNIKFNISKIDISLFLLSIYLLINRYYIPSNYGFSIRFIEFSALICLYIILRNFGRHTFYGILLAIIISGILQASYGNLQLLGFYPSNHARFNITGSFFNPGPYAGFLASVYPIALGMYLFREKLIELSKANTFYSNKLLKFTSEYIPLLGIITIMLVIPATQSRSAWLSILISSMLLLELRYRILSKFINQANTLKRSIITFMLLLVLGIGLFSIYQFKKGSSDGRLFIWKVSSKIIKDHPIFGIGFDRFKTHYMNYQANYFSSYGPTKETLVADNSYYAFNELIQFTVENGIIGILFLILVGYQIIKLQTAYKSLKIVSLLGILSICVFALFSYPMEILPIKLILTILLASLASYDSKKLIFQKSKPTKALKPVIVIAVVFILSLNWKYFNGLNHSLKSWKQALEHYQYGDYETSIATYKRAYPYLKNNGDFLMNYGKALAMNSSNIEAIEVLNQAQKHLNTTIIETALGDVYKNTKQYDKAETAYKRAANMIPSRFYPLYLLAKLYETKGDTKNAVAMAKTILKKDVKVSSTAIKEIQQEMQELIQKDE